MSKRRFFFQGNKSTPCDPWTTREFNSALSRSNESCPHCLTDCEKITFSVAHSAANFRKCDSRNLNLAPFCKLDSIADSNKLNRWLKTVLSQYNKSRGGVPLPSYLNKNTVERSSYPGDMADGELLEHLTKDDSTYDAFENDIAVINLFYGDPEFAGDSSFSF